VAQRRGVFPGSFDPPTIAHLAIGEAALRTHQLDVVVFSLSTSPLGKDAGSQSPLDNRVAVLELEASRREWLSVEVTDDQLLADIAGGFDLLVLGADKWQQIQDPAFYGNNNDARDAALARLPTLAIAPRPPHEAPPELLLQIDPNLGLVSSTGVRQGRSEHMAPAGHEHAAAKRFWLNDGNSSEVNGVEISED
jgi:hypothetical protein